MTKQTTPKEGYGKFSMEESILNENYELSKISKLIEASLVEKDKQISALYEELSRLDDEISHKEKLLRNLQNQLEQQKL